MSSRLLVRGATGLAFLMVVGVSLTLIPAAHASPVSQSAALKGLPSNLAISGSHSVGPSATCTVTVALVANPPVLRMGQHIQLQTQVLFHKSGPSAVCMTPVAFFYTALPSGCMTVSLPQVSCMAQGPGVYPTTVHVYFPSTQMTATTSVAVLAP
ncbi:MAG: hypothetical protein L3K15_03005 [Thermoplasmata archaeon]|nr:hypothetical protein [Thermoplasmata archaeon]